MALSTKVGSFAKIDTVTTQAVTGVGFVPKAIVFWAAGSNAASGTWDAEVLQCVGYTAGAANSYATAGGSKDGVTTPEAARRMAAKALTFISSAGTLLAEADLSSFDADGFTLNWTTNGAGNVSATPIMYMAIGGTDVTNAKVVNWTTPSTAINKAVTGVGFKPDLVLHAAGDVAGALPVNSTTANELTFGAMNKHGQQWSNTIATYDAASPANSDTQRAQQTDACYISISNTPAVFEQAHYVSMDADGFTTNFSTASATAYNVVSLCLKGVSSKLGAFSKTTAAAPASQTIDRVGFTSKAALFTSFQSTASGTPVTNSIHCMGAADGTNERSSCLVDYDIQSTTAADSIFMNDKAIVLGTTQPIIHSAADLTSFDSDGFTLNWTTNANYASEVLYLTLGDSGTDTTPAYVRNSLQTDATAFSNQRKLDRTQDGTLWAVADYDNATGTFTYSKDEGVTWTEVGSANILGFTNGSLFIDIDDYAHVVWKQNGTSGGRTDQSIYYMRGVPNAGRTTWTWGAALEIITGVERDYPDVVAHREGTGWKAHVVFSRQQSGGNAETVWQSVTITSIGAVSLGVAAQLYQATPTVFTYPSIDFKHIGDGKTISGSTPDLYVAWSTGTTGVGKGIRFKKGTYSAGVWTWGGDQTIDTTVYIFDPAYSLNCMFDGTRVVITGYLWTGSAELTKIWDRDEADTATTPQLSESFSQANRLYGGSFAYDKSGNIYMMGRRGTPEASIQRKWTRVGGAITTTELSSEVFGTQGYFSAKRGYSNNRVEWIYTSGNNSPYSIRYDYIATGGSNPTVTLSSPADGVSVDLSTGPTFSWSFSDADSETQASYALRRRVQGTTEYEYWNATTVGWQAVLIYNSSTTSSVTFPAEWWQGGTIYEWSVSAKDTGGATSAFASNRTVTNSAARTGVRTKVGSFSSPTVTGTQAITGVGFTPKAIIFFTTGSDDVSGTWSGDIFQAIGYTTGSSNSYSVAGASANGAGTSNTDRRIAAKAITLTNAGAALSEEADLSSLDADGFTLNWTTAHSLQRNISYLALGGDDITGAKVAKWTAPTSAINKAVTGVGFKPDMVLHAGAYGGTSTDTSIPFTGSHHSFSFGAMNKHGQQWANGLFSTDALVSNSDTQRSQQTDACIAETHGSLGWRVQAHYVSMDTDGFTINFSTGAAGASDNHVFVSLALKGVSSKLGAFAKTIDVAPVNQDVTLIGFTPKAALFASKMAAASGSPESQSVFGMGASDGTNERATVQWDSDALSTTNAKSMFMDNRAFIHNNTVSQPADGQANANVSFSADTITMSWQKNNSEDSEILYVALADANTSTVPQFIDSSTDSAATGFQNQRKLDRTQNGNLWTVFWNGTSTTNASLEFWYSTDGGVTWAEDTAGRLGFSGTGTTHVPEMSFFIDLDDYAHLVYHDRNDGFLYYRRGTLTSGSWVWSAANVVYNGAAGYAQYADVVAHRRSLADGDGWNAHIIWGMDNDINEASYVRYRLVTITSGGGISIGTVETLTPAASGNTNHKFPSIDFNHIGDGKTIKGGTPHLYAAWSTGGTGAGFGIRFRKATYTAGPTWTWGTNVEVDSTMYVLDATGGYWLNCLFDGENVIIGGELWTGASPGKLRIWQRRDAGETATENLYSADGAVGSQWHWGSLTYDQNRNLYIAGASTGAAPYNLAYRKWTRTGISGGTLGSTIELDARVTPPYVTFRRGYNGNLVEAVYTFGNNSPYSVKYISISTSASGTGSTFERWGQIHV